MSSSIISFYAMGVVGLVSALVVASSLNPVHRIAFLILVFLSGSFLMVLLDFYFLGLTYIIVYVGAIMILFLFVIMMVQIHLMPVSTSISPRILDSTDLKSTVLALQDDQAVSSIGAGENNGVSRVGGGFGKNSHLFSVSSILWIVTGLVPLLYLYFIPHNTGYGGGNMIVNYFFPSWFVEFKTMTDLETLANILYLGYPTALLLVGVTLWAVLIGIIKVTASKA